MVEKTLELVDVVVEHSKQPTAAVLLEKSEFQLLQMVVGLKTQAVLRGLGQVAPENVVEVFEQGFGGPHHKREQSQSPELLHGRTEAKARQP